MENIHDKQSKVTERLSESGREALNKEVTLFTKHSHDQHREVLLFGLRQRSREDLINAFIIEMEAKNEAYYFIIERGHFNEFREYCQSPLSSPPE